MNFILGPDETLTGGIEDTARASSRRPSPTGAPGRARAGVAAGVAGRGDPRGHHAQAVAVRGHRRHRRGHDHQHPRSAGQRAQLGLPLLLAARRLLRGARAQQPVRSGDDGGVPALADNIVVRSGGGHIQPLYGIGQEEQLPESILGPPAGLPRHGPGARGQPGAGALPARRVRQHRAGRVAGLPRPPPVPPRRRAPSSATWRRSASRPSASTTSPTPACGSCARARASTPRRRS